MDEMGCLLSQSAKGYIIMGSETLVKFFHQ